MLHELVSVCRGGGGELRQFTKQAFLFLFPSKSLNYPSSSNALTYTLTYFPFPPYLSFSLSWVSRPSCTIAGPNSYSATQVAPAGKIGVMHHPTVD